MKIGEAYIEVHADTTNLATEVKKGATDVGNAMESGVQQGGKKATTAAQKAGKDIGTAGLAGGKTFGKAGDDMEAGVKGGSKKAAGHAQSAASDIATAGATAGSSFTKAGTDIEEGVKGGSKRAATSAKDAAQEIETAGSTVGQSFVKAGTEIETGIQGGSKKAAGAAQSAAQEISTAGNSAGAGFATAGAEMEKGVKAGGTKASTAAKTAGKEIGDAGVEGGKTFAAGIKQGTDQAGTAWRNITQLIVGGAFIKGVKDTIGAASDLNETVSKSAQIFGQDAVPALEQFGKAAATAMGQSEKSAIDAATGFGLLLQNTGFAKDETLGLSEKLTQLAGDFASFFNTSPEDAVYAIGAAFRGETEPIRRYGIFLNDASLKQEALNQGLYSGKGVLDQNAKSHAALAIILQQSAQAQGDFARTADGAANKERIVAAEAENAKAKIGAGLLPVYKEVLNVTGALVTAFGNLPQPIQQAAVALTALALLKGPVLLLGSSIGSMAASLFALGPAAAVAIGALGALYIIFSNAGTITEDNTAVTKKYTEALKDMASGAEKAFDDLRRAVLTTEGNTALISKLGLTVDQVAKAMAGSPADYGKFISAVGQAAQGSDDAQKAFEALKFTLGDIKWGEEAAAATQLNLAIASLGKSGVDSLVASTDISTQALAGLMQAMQDGTVSAGELSLSSGDAAKVIDILGKAMAAQKDGAKGAAGAEAGLTEKTDSLADSLKKGADNAGLFKKNLDLLTGAALSQITATDNYQAAIDDWSKSLKDNGRTLDEHTEKGRSNRESIVKSTEAAFANADAMIHNGQTTQDAADFINNDYVPALEAQLRKLGLNEDEVAAYIAQLHLTPTDVTTAIEMTGQEKARADLKAHLDQINGIPKEKETEIKALIDAGALSTAHLELDKLTQPRSVRVQLETNIAAIISSLGPFASILGFKSKKFGGPIEGPPDQPVPIIAHGGEYVLTKEVVDDIKQGRPPRDVAQMSAMQLTGNTPALRPPAGSDGATVYAPLTINGDVDKATAEELLREWQRTVLDTYAAGRRR